jgi:hypothetical protein
MVAPGANKCPERVAPPPTLAGIAVQLPDPEPASRNSSPPGHVRSKYLKPSVCSPAASQRSPVASRSGCNTCGRGDLGAVDPQPSAVVRGEAEAIGARHRATNERVWRTTNRSLRPNGPSSPQSSRPPSHRKGSEQRASGIESGLAVAGQKNHQAAHPVRRRSPAAAAVVRPPMRLVILRVTVIVWTA